MYNMQKIDVLIITLFFPFIFLSCSKNDVKTPDNPVEIVSGMYVLNQGTFQGNNTTLTFYDYETNSASTDFYKNVNGSSLGDTGNDMIIYGSKLYIVMNVSSYLEVAEASTAKSIKKIELKNSASQPLTPRNIVGYKNRVFVSCWDGSVQVIDTTTLAVTTSIKVGANPEQMAIVGTNLYVTNSGGITPGYDSTVSVIDLTSMKETSKITVGTNPTTIAADNSGNLYVGFIGNYTDIKPGLVRVSTETNTVNGRSDVEASQLKFSKNNLFSVAGGFGAQRAVILNTDDLSIKGNGFITDGTTVAIPFGLNIDETNGDVYITDAVDYITSPSGMVYCFDESGKKKFSFSVDPGINPCKIAFVRK